MPEHRCQLFVNARFEVIWEKLIDKIYHPQKYVQGIRNVEILEEEKDHLLRLIQFENLQWEELKELIVHDKSQGIIVYRLISHPFFQGETRNICRTTNQIYQCQLEYQIDWKLIHQGEESQEDQQFSHQALQLAIEEMKRISEEAEAIYGKPSFSSLN